MASLIGKVLTFVVLSIVIITVAIYPLPYYSINQYERVYNNGIGTIDIEMKDRQVFMVIHLKSSMTCREALSILDITNIEINNATYAPICNLINDRLIKINYEKVVLI